LSLSIIDEIFDTVRNQRREQIWKHICTLYVNWGDEKGNRKQTKSLDIYFKATRIENEYAEGVVHEGFRNPYTNVTIYNMVTIHLLSRWTGLFIREV
jgi:hypothetical protein